MSKVDLPSWGNLYLIEWNPNHSNVQFLKLYFFKKLGSGMVFFFFFSNLASDFSSLRPWNPPLFIRGGRWTFRLYWCQILALDSTWKDPNYRFKMAIMGCHICCRKGLVRLDTLGRCHNYCGFNRPERTTLGYSQMSGHRLRVRFV